MFPNARTMRGLGIVEFELRHYLASVDLLVQALASRERPLTPEQRAATQQLLERARRFVGKLVVKVSPPDARVVLDGALVSAGQSLPLQVGDHDLVVQAPGHATVRKPITISGGAEKTLSIDLIPSTRTLVEGPPTAAPVTAAETGPGVAPFVTLGISAVVLAGGAALLVLAANHTDDVETAAPDTRWAEVSSAYDAAPIEFGLGVGLLAAGAIGAGLSLWWSFAGDDDAEAGAAIAVSPRGVYLGGQF